LQEFTCCVWMRPQSGALGLNRSAVNRGTSYWSLTYNGGVISGYMGAHRSSGVAGVAGRWDFAAITVSGGVGSLWVNGARRYEQAHSLAASTNNLRFGAYTGCFIDIGESVYTLPMSDNQIKYLYESTRHRFGV